MAIKRRKKEKKGAPGWMVSYGDMTTLLLVFFITMISFAEIQGKDFFLILSSFRGSLGMFEGGYSLSAGRLEELGQNMLNLPSTRVGSSLAKSVRKAIAMFKPEISTRMVRVFEDERGLVVSLTADSFFDPGSAILKSQVRPVLKKVGKILNSLTNFARIEGHTDSRATSVTKSKRTYETNWELSSARSVNVLRYLSEEENVSPKRLSAVAFGEFRPLDKNKSPEGRAYNRRVDIVIVRDKRLQGSKVRKITRPLPDEEWR
ncbi:OmpA family protein [Spirochaetota bacterium]